MLNTILKPFVLKCFAYTIACFLHDLTDLYLTFVAKMKNNDKAN